MTNSIEIKTMERLLKAVANQRRLAIIRLLKNKNELTVSEISSAIKLSFRSTSKHLAVLLAMDIVEKEQRSVEVFYRLSVAQEPVIKYLLSCL